MGKTAGLEAQPTHSKSALFSGWSQVHLCDGSLASLRSSLVSSGMLSVPVKMVFSSPAALTYGRVTTCTFVSPQEWAVDVARLEDREGSHPLPS